VGPEQSDPVAKGRWFFQVALVTAPLSFIFVGGHVLFTPHALHHTYGGDFVDFWVGARLLLQGRVFEMFDPMAFRHALLALAPPGSPPSSLPYPPSYYPLIAWIGLFPLGIALELWSLLGVAALLTACWPFSRNPWVAGAVLVSPAVAFSLDLGQNGLFTAALIIGGLRQVDRRPWLAGVLLGLATFKPQLGLLIPVALVAAGRWRVIGWAAASAATLAAVGTLLTGAQAWAYFLTRTLPFQRDLIATGYGQGPAMTPSLLVAAHSSGLSLQGAWIFQALASLLCAIAVFLWFGRLRAQRRGIAGVDILLLVTAGMVAAPYAFAYDMPATVLALVLACEQRPELDTRAAWRWGGFLLWEAPIFMFIVGVLPWPGGVAWYGSGAIMLTGALILIGVALRQGRRFSAPDAGADSAFNLFPRLTSAVPKPSGHQAADSA